MGNRSIKTESGATDLQNERSGSLNQIILLVGVVIMICVLMGRVTSRLAVPSLLIFIGLGMLFGEDGSFRRSCFRQP